MHRSLRLFLSTFQQGAAEVAYDIVSPTDNLPSGSNGKLVKRRVNSEPADLRQGIANAYNVVTEVSLVEFCLFFNELNRHATIYKSMIHVHGKPPTQTPNFESNLNVRSSTF